MCNEGYYGKICDSSCGHCVNGEMCDKNNGTCYNGCVPNYQQPKCKGVRHNHNFTKETFSL